MRRGRSGCALLLTGVVVLLYRTALTHVPTLAAAQQQGNPSQSPEATRPKGQSGRPASSSKSAELFEIHGVVITVGGKTIAGAQVEINLQGVEGKPQAPQTVATDIHGEFRAKLPPPGHSSRPFEIALDASKDGFLDAHDWIEAAPGGVQNPVELALLKPVEDPHLLPLDVLADVLAAKLRAPAGEGQPADIDAPHYVLALRLLGRSDTQSAAPVFADVARRNPACMQCQTLAGLTALESGGWSSAASELSRAAHLAVSARGEERTPDAFIALGVLETWRGDFPKAIVSFLQALALQPDNSLALQELGRVFVLENKMAAADRYLQRALAHGAGADAHLLRAEVLLEMEQPQKAQAELDAYLAGRKPKELPEGSRSLWSELIQRVNIESRSSSSTIVQRKPAELAAEFPELKGLVPDEDQSQLESVLRKVGESVEALFQSFPDTSSHEEIQMEALHPNGTVAQSQAQHFEYLMVKTSDEYGLRLSEYRTDKAGNRATPGGGTEGTRYMVTLGFASHPLIFHPDYQVGSSLRLIGHQSLDGHDTLVIAFAQRPATAKMLEEFRISNGSAVVLIQGIAWVDAASYQVLRMRTDLLNPAPEVRLEAQATDVRFGEVRFPARKQALWLPQEVSVTVHWNGRTFRNRHHYSDFELFQVKTHQQIKAPKPGESQE
jgi:tetratricopeptide (TPR) repeat protein